MLPLDLLYLCLYFLQFLHQLFNLLLTFSILCLQLSKRRIHSTEVNIVTKEVTLLDYQFVNTTIYISKLCFSKTTTLMPLLKQKSFSTLQRHKIHRHSCKRKSVYACPIVTCQTVIGSHTIVKVKTKLCKASSSQKPYRQKLYQILHNTKQ